MLTIQIWRSYWSLLDKYLFASNQLYSALICLLSGTLIYSIVYLLKDMLNKHLSQNHEQESKSSIKTLKLFFTYYEKLVLLRVFIIINFIAVIHIWRGLWNLQTLAIYNDEQKVPLKIVICSVCIILSLIVLLFMNRVSAILSRGNCKDELFFLKEKYIIVETISNMVCSPKV